MGASSVGRFFVLPLRFIGAIALGSSCEVARASSGWLEKPAPRRGHSVASAPRSGLRQVAGTSGARWLLALGLGAAAPAGANPCPGAGRRRRADRQAGTALRVSAPHSHVSRGARGLSTQVRGTRRGQEPPGKSRDRAGVPGAAALPRASRASSNFLSSLSSLLH